MRVSREVAARNRRNVVETAGELFREHGYDGIGIAALMKEAGLTQGGFYKQFASKEALAAEATAAAIAENRGRWEDAISASDASPAEAVADFYLSEAHLAQRRQGCAFAALACEAPRHPDVRDAFTDGVERAVEMLAPGGDQTAREAAMAQLARQVGALVLARAVGDPALAEELLNAARGARS